MKVLWVNFYNVIFYWVNLELVNFNRVNLRGVDFYKVNLENVFLCFIDFGSMINVIEVKLNFINF